MEVAEIMRLQNFYPLFYFHFAFFFFLQLNVADEYQLREFWMQGSYLIIQLLISSSFAYVIAIFMIL